MVSLWLLLFGYDDDYDSDVKYGYDSDKFSI